MVSVPQGCLRSHAKGPSGRGGLVGFWEMFYGCLSSRADELFELTEALLCTDLLRRYARFAEPVRKRAVADETLGGPGRGSAAVGWRVVPRDGAGRGQVQRSPAAQSGRAGPGPI